MGVSTTQNLIAHFDAVLCPSIPKNDFLKDGDFPDIHLEWKAILTPS